jgi:hypothetical protein
VTNLPETPTTPAGWYPDYTGQPQLRWWDGARWTEHVHASAPQSYPTAQQQAQPYVATAAPAQVAKGTPVYNPFIWVFVLLPIVGIVTSLTLGTASLSRMSMTDPTSALRSPGYYLSGGISLLIYAASVLLAFFDHRRLRRDGFERPFHWAFAFIPFFNYGTYVIGRSVIVRRRSGGGLAVLWTWIALELVAIIVGIIVAVNAIEPYLNNINGVVPNA